MLDFPEVKIILLDEVFQQTPGDIFNDILGLFRTNTVCCKLHRKVPGKDFLQLFLDFSCLRSYHHISYHHITMSSYHHITISSGFSMSGMGVGTLPGGSTMPQSTLRSSLLKITFPGNRLETMWKKISTLLNKSI